MEIRVFISLANLKNFGRLLGDRLSLGSRVNTFTNSIFRGVLSGIGFCLCTLADS